MTDDRAAEQEASGEGRSEFFDALLLVAQEAAAFHHRHCEAPLGRVDEYSAVMWRHLDEALSRLDRIDPVWRTR